MEDQSPGLRQPALLGSVYSGTGTEGGMYTGWCIQGTMVGIYQVGR